MVGRDCGFLRAPSSVFSAVLAGFLTGVSAGVGAAVFLQPPGQGCHMLGDTLPQDFIFI